MPHIIEVVDYQALLHNFVRRSHYAVYLPILYLDNYYRFVFNDPHKS